MGETFGQPQLKHNNPGHSLDTAAMDSPSNGSTESPTKGGLQQTETPVFLEEKGTYRIAGLEAFHVPIDTYEGRHRYDPEFTWEPEEERRLVRKVCHPLL
jgi:hypothetical protein